MPSPTVSIVMATYNGARFLAEQLASIAAQSHLPDELVAVDDGSNDATRDVLADFAANAPFPVRIEHNPQNLGYNATFARAAALANGDIVFFCDQDDIWLPAKIAEVIERFDREPDTMVVTHDQWIFDDATGEPWDGTYFDRASALGLGRSDLVSGNCTAVRKPFLEFLQPFPAAPNFDYHINWMADALEVRSMLAEPLQRYRRHAENASTPPILRRDGASLSARVATRAATLATQREEQANLAAIAARLAAPTPLFPPDRLADVRSRLEDRTAALDWRNRQLERAMVPALAGIVAGLFAGRYAAFSGWKSAAKDIVTIVGGR